jgi:hypothetical protein
VEGGGGVRDFKRGDEIAAVGYRTVMDAAPTLLAAMPYIRTEAG